MQIRCADCGSTFGVVGDDTASRQIPGAAPSAPRKLAHFELLEPLGSGTFGTVWKARDTQLDRIVAVKIPRRGQLTRKEAEKFIREPRAAAQMRHPNIVGVHEVGIDGDVLYIVSDCVEGVSLEAWLKDHWPTFLEMSELCAKVAEAIDHAHEQGVIHRDLTPGNILIDAAEEPHITDFGLAKRETGEITMTMTGEILGTPAYMPPEQARGEGHEVDRRADVYSIGVILYRLMTGVLPFRGHLRLLLKEVIEDDPVPPRTLNRDVPQDLETICLKCLEKEPANRYATALQLAEDLRHFQRSEPIVASPVERMERAWRWCRRNPGVSVLSLATLLLLAVGLGAAALLVVEGLRPIENALQITASSESGNTKPPVIEKTSGEVPAVMEMKPTTDNGSAAKPQGAPDETSGSDDPTGKPKQTPPDKPIPSSPPSPVRLIEEQSGFRPEFLVNGHRSTWAPTGRKIAFGAHATLGGDFADGGIAVFDLASRTTTKLTDDGKDPAWSGGAGRWIAYAKPGPQTEEVWVMESSGANSRKIADGGFPSWSAGGKTLFFSSRPNPRLMAVDIDEQGGASAPRALGVSSAGFYPAITPDGKRWAYRLDDAFAIAETESGEVIKAFRHIRGRSFLGDWSPDGNRLAFGGFGGSDRSPCMVVDLDAERAWQWPSELTMPAWSPDGKKIAFDVRSSEGIEIWLFDVATFKALDAVDLKPLSIRATSP